jgi:hypothetical protein
MRALADRDRAWTIAVAIVAITAVALRVAWQLRSGFYDGPRTFEEDEIARNLLAGRGYVYQFLGTERLTFGLPAFPLILAGLHALDGGPDRYRLIGIVQAGLSAITVLAAWSIGTQLLARAAGMLAAIAVALHPALIFYSAVAVFPPVYEHALAAVVFLAALALVRCRSVASAIGFGAAVAVAVVLRPNVALGAAAVLGGLFLRPPRTVLLVAAAIPIAVVLATSARNFTAVGHAAPTPTGCTQLWVGNNPWSMGGAMAADGTSVFDAMDDELKARVYGRTEREQEQAFCDATAAFFADQPRATFWQATKLFYFWWFSPVAGLLYPPGAIEVYKVVYGAEVALALIGAVVVWRKGWRAGLLTLLVLMFVISFVQALFYVDGRHRLIVEPVLAAVAGCGAVTLARIVSERRSGGSVPA